METDEVLNAVEGFRLPIDLITERLAFIGVSGSGKTYGAGRLAEAMDDVDRIEAARGKPYVKLRETVVLADAARDIHSMSAATGNETKEAES